MTATRGAPAAMTAGDVAQLATSGRRIGRISIAPVKGLALRHPQTVGLPADGRGVAEDRRFVLVDPNDRVVDGGRHGPLVQVQADYDAERDWLTLRFPDGAMVEGPAGADGGKPFEARLFSRSVPANLVPGPFGPALSRYTSLDLRLARPRRAGTGYDEHAVTLVSSASVAELARHAHVEPAWDARRFRMLFQIDGCRPHEEDGWNGRRVRFGAAVILVGGPVPRCAVTTQSPDTGLPDLRTLHVIKKYRGLGADGTSIDFGVYGEVVEPGPARVGDPVVPE